MDRRLGLISLLLALLLIIVRMSNGAGGVGFELPPFSNDAVMDLPAPAPSEIEKLPPIDEELSLPVSKRLPPINHEVQNEKETTSDPVEYELLPSPHADVEGVELVPPIDRGFQRLPSSEWNRLPATGDSINSDPINSDTFEGDALEDSECLENGQPIPLDFSTDPLGTSDSVQLFDVPQPNVASDDCNDEFLDSTEVVTTPFFDEAPSDELPSDETPHYIIPETQPGGATLAPMPNSVGPVWWQPLVSRPMRNTSQPLPISLDQLISATVCYSDQLRVYSDTPLIRDMVVAEEDAGFDWVGFTEAMWNDTTEPVGSTLTTGGPSRFQDERVETRFGLRRRSTSGGRFEAGQEFGHQNTNSVFFQPNNQGTSQLTLSYTQPLLRGAGRVYNSSLIVLAQIDASVARDEFSTQLQTHLLDVTNGYWTLFQQRGALLQKERLFKRGQEILVNLENRQEIDALASQVVRARAAVAIRRADLYRAATQVKNAESRIRALVNAPQLGLVDQFELLPVDAPGSEFIPIQMSEAMTLAIKNRPEIHQAVKRVKSAAVRKNMSANELLPVLDLVLETYVRGLRGNSQVFEAFGDSFSDGAPSYTAGLQMEIPLGNRSARAAMRRREIELRQLQSQFRATVDVLQLEVEVVVREVHTAFQEIKAKYQSMKAAEHEVEYLTQRWKILSGEDRSAALVLEDVLAAQERLANEELGYLAAQIAYNQSFTDLKQVTGSLLQLESIDINTMPGHDGNPVLQTTKSPSYADHTFPAQHVGYEAIADQFPNSP